MEKDRKEAKSHYSGHPPLPVGLAIEHPDIRYPGTVLVSFKEKNMLKICSNTYWDARGARANADCTDAWGCAARLSVGSAGRS